MSYIKLQTSFIGRISPQYGDTETKTHNDNELNIKHEVHLPVESLGHS